VSLDGEDLTGASCVERARRGLCLIPEGRGVFRQLTVRENLAVAACGRDVGDAVDRALSLFPRLASRLGQVAGSLSGGEQQMLSLARAMVTEPRIVLADELSVGLAPIVVDEIFAALTALRGEVSLLVVEQYVDRLLGFADYVAILHKGSVAMVGEPAQCRDADVIAHYLGAEATGGASRGGAAWLQRGGAPRRTAPAVAAEPADRTGAGLIAQDITVRFGGVVAIDGFSLAAPPGRITGLIGPNGAGKTTMFNVCSGFQSSDAGTILLDGLDITGEPPATRARRGLARTFQQLSLFGSMTVRQNIALAVESRHVTGHPLSQLGVVRRSRRADEDDEVDGLLAGAGLSEIADRPAHTLPTGQARLVELARALARRPRVLLLDEPASGLDGAESQAFGDLLVRLVAQSDMGVLLVEHDMSLALTICDWLYVLDFGRPLIDGPPDVIASSSVVRAAYLGTLGAPV
jgi:ABC-type branched-subunit amino acid transport system ATPase component